MKLKSILLLTSFLILGGLFNVNAQQQSRPRQSPKITTTGKIGDANMTITYGSPAVKGRKIWGELVPFDKVWRAGANEVTQIETDKDLVVEGKKLPAGKYSLYTIPGEKTWQVIFNSQTGQWGIERSGETTRNPEKDVIVVAVKPSQSVLLEENLIYVINNKGLVLKWENLEVPLVIK
jgi:hypothetical protein